MGGSYNATEISDANLSVNKFFLYQALEFTGAVDFNNLTGFTNEPRTAGIQFKGNF